MSDDSRPMTVWDEKAVLWVCEKGHLDDRHYTTGDDNERCSRCGGECESMTVASLVSRVYEIDAEVTRRCEAFMELFDGPLGRVMRERIRQIDQHGYDASHDDSHANGELLEAALAYLTEVTTGHFAADPIWPFTEPFLPEHDDVANLIKAMALVLAEIDRLERDD